MMDDNMKDLIGRADEKIAKTTASAEMQTNKSKKRPVVIGLLLVLLVLLNIGVFYGRATAPSQEQAESPLPLIELVDAYIRGQYEESGVLPETIDDALLASFTNYQVLDSHTYELQLLVDDNNTPLVISVTAHWICKYQKLASNTNISSC